MSDNEIATSIVEKSKYIVVGTSYENTVWVAPVMFFTDDNNFFYFVSDINSLHLKHILLNPFVAVAIFDSTIPEGKGNKTGIQFKGIAKVLTRIDNLNNILISCKQRLPGATFKELENRCAEWYKNNRVVCQIIPLSNKIFLNTFDKVDKRIQVNFTRTLSLQPFRSKL